MKLVFTHAHPRKRSAWFPVFHFSVFFFLLSCFGAFGDDVGDISADASAIYTGNTFHGYAEIRVDLQNRSHSKAHTVTLTFPNNSYASGGNSIRSLSRTVTLAPESVQSVSLLRPPLPSGGDGSIRVEVDDGHAGQIHAPNANSHCGFYSSSDESPTVFISRSLNDSAIEHLFNANQGAFTASMAVGPPDAPGPGPQPTTWMPDNRAGMQTNWLELDYATAQPIDKVVVYNTQHRRSHLQGTVTLIGTQGTNIATIPMTSGKQTSGAAGWLEEYDLNKPSAPVKTVRLNFGRSAPFIAIDAVQISGPSGSQWAADARASSDNSARASAYAPGSGANQLESLRAETAVTEWSETWLAYSPFDAIVLADSDVAAMSPAVFNAIANFLQAGGNIVLFGTSDLPAAWHPWNTRKVDGGVEYEIGFGHCYVFGTENPASLDRSAIQTLRSAVRESALYWQSLPQDSGAGESALPIHETTKVPARSTVLVMFLFVLTIGPANLFVLSRIKRRIWVLWTIPAISLATTMLIFVYSLLREGVTPDTRICGLTVLDQVSHHAATFGGESFYCPLTPGGGLKFDYETEATPLVNIQNYQGGASREVDWSQSQHFTSGWVSARVPAYFHLRRSGTSRERIVLSTENGSLQIVNGLGAPIRSLWLADAKMNFYQANNVPAGQKTGMIPAKQSQPLDQSGPTGLRRDLGFGAVGADKLGSGAQRYLMPNTYIAVLDENPFLENGLSAHSSPKRTKSIAVIFGILENSQK
ncbi:MAG TPA: hypothetical protein VH280_13465 [Verrucomicrobiae bacterium]|jgi:hypothetical protein|nr:hypothetical protein [Verrucomicrobiae bacterium]